MPSVFENSTARVVDEAIRNTPREPRAHLGMSGIAGDARANWLNFRWSLPDDIEPRTRRIFSLGHVIEAEVVKYLKRAGFEVYADDGSAQFGFKALGGHYAGSIDGAIRGLPESRQWHVLEVKSINRARFKALEQKGVKEWEPLYFGQMQCYMHHSGMKRALFVGYNKDTSEIYFERVKVDPLYGPAMLEKAREIITGEIPASSYPNRTWHEIKNYKSEHYQRVYWGDELPPRPNCRNCRFSVADVDDPENRGEWGCMKKRRALSLDEQIAGCGEHNWRPCLVESGENGVEITKVTDDAVAYQNKDGTPFTNGPDGYTSAELVELSKVDYSTEWLTDPTAAKARELFDARIEKIEPEENAA